MVDDYAKVEEWVADGGQPHVLLGNGFSMAYDSDSFGYQALASWAQKRDFLSDGVAGLMEKLGTPDFEAAMRQIESAIQTLKVLDEEANRATIEQLEEAVAELREALAQSIAGLHPERPYEIAESCYGSVRRFLAPFKNIYTVSYDLLLYWSLMQEIVGDDGKILYPSQTGDDGFRDSQTDGDSTVLWDIYDSFKQNVYYLHGALHLFRGDDGLRKLTWVRTDDPLIEQVRSQLQVGRYPLYVAESDSNSKLNRISRSAYLSRGLRSLGNVSHGLVVYGHSLDPNDEHVLEAIVRSRVDRLAVSIYGDPGSDENIIIARRAKGLEQRRLKRSRNPLDVRFYDAESVQLWQPV